MKVTEHINQAKDTLVSFEILPPLKGKSIQSIFEHLDPLMAFNPSWINVTYHRSESMFKKKSDGTFDKVEVRKSECSCLEYCKIKPFRKNESKELGDYTNSFTTL